MNTKDCMVFLGGTCNNSTWRQKLIPMLNCQYFDPVVPDWNEAAYQKELHYRATADVVLYTITPAMTGVYSIAEVVDDSNKRPKQTMLVLLKEFDGKSFEKHVWKSLEATAKMVAANGGTVFYSLEEAAEELNHKSGF